MSDNILEIKSLPSGATAIASETEQGVGIEVGTGIIFIAVDDIYNFGLFLKKIDKYYLKRQ